MTASPRDQDFDSISGSSPDGEFNTADLFKRMEEEAAAGFDSMPGPLAKVFAFAIYPRTPARLTWDVIILVLVLYSSVAEPYKAAFKPTEGASQFGQFVDAMFWADIVLSFWTGFDRGYEVEMEKGKIIQHYVQGWFLLDLCATLQWSWVVRTITGRASDSPLIRMARFLKVLRLARMSRLINRLTANWTLHSGFSDAFKFFTYVFVVAHLLACFFFLWPTLHDCDDESFGSTVEASPAADAMQCILDYAEGRGSCDTAVLAEGWHWKGSCMQGSWRQAYGLEEICEVGTHAEVSEKMLACQRMYELGLQPGESGVWNGSEFTAPPERCKTCMRGFRLYIDSVYWSVTTMTTIGYGDRGPKTETEIQFVIFAEVFGLCFFALLLTQIVNVADVMATAEQQHKDEKNDVVQFVKYFRLDDELVDGCVKFLNFRNSSLSGNAYDRTDERFAVLSPGLRVDIQQAVYRPILEGVRMFGWHEDDIAEMESVRKMFQSIDVDGGGALDKTETNSLFRKLGYELTEMQFDTVFSEMDKEGGGDVSFYEFQHWWFLRKYGKPQIRMRAPAEFLNMLCGFINAQAFAKDEVICKKGDYGKSMVICLSGRVQIISNEGSTGGQEEATKMEAAERDFDEQTPREKEMYVSADDREPLIGIASCLNAGQWCHIRNRTDK